MGQADKGEALETICPDFSSALDAIPQDTLMSKLGNLGLVETKDGHKTLQMCSNQQFVVDQKSILSRVLDESLLAHFYTYFQFQW